MYCRILLCLLATVQLLNAHSYHSGHCPKPTPMKGFDIEKFLGKWYVIEKTKSNNKKQILEYSHGDKNGEFKVVENAVRPIIGRTDYSGRLTPSDNPAHMKVKFLLNPGSYDYTVFTTDYVNYAGVFSCQGILGHNRRSASILSRTPTLDKTYIEKIHEDIRAFGVNPDDLRVIEQDELATESPVRPVSPAQEGEGRGSVKPVYEDGDDTPWDIDPRFGQPTKNPSSNSTDLHLF